MNSALQRYDEHARHCPACQKADQDHVSPRCAIGQARWKAAMAAGDALKKKREQGRWKRPF